MSGTRRGVMLLALLVAMMAGWVNTAVAQITTTTVQDTVYSANGTPASGTVLVSWNAFTTSNGQSVPAGTTSVTIGAGGALSIALAPNAGSTPMGNYYTAVFHLSDGTTSRQYWVIPVTVGGGGPVTLAAIKNEVLPISVAMQTVSKEYVDDAIAAASTGFPLSSSPYVLTAGDSMSGPLLLPADPVNTNQAATKHYVDTSVGTVEAGLVQKVSLLPTATQAVSQPNGTSFSIAGPYANTTFSGTGTSAQATITSNTTAANPGATGFIQDQKQMDCFQQGFDLGNNGTSAQGWSTCAMDRGIFDSTSRGIDQMYSGEFTHNGQGDTAYSYHYLTSFGGKVAASDEGVEDTVIQNHQIGYTKGTLAIPTAGNLGQAYGPTASGYTYLTTVVGPTVTPSFPISGTLTTLSAIWPSGTAATAQTADFVIATSNGSNSYTITNVIPVPLAAGTGTQTFTPANFGSISVNAGQMIGLYVPTGTGPASSSINALCLSGPPSLGAATFTNSCPTAGIILQATLSPPTTGATSVMTTGVSCNGYCDALAGGVSFADGGILLDTSKAGSTATIAAKGSAMNALYVTLGSGTAPVSSAWGNILTGSCTNNGNGQLQQYTSTTCNIALGTSPASPSSFATSSSAGDICLVGTFQEEAAVIAVGAVSAGVQSVTFNTRYAWNNGGSALVMQGGPCGQSFVATNTVTSWPVAYAVAGATSSTQVFFSNCVVGSCNSGLTLSGPTIYLSGLTAVRTGGSLVTLTWGNGSPPYYFAVGSTIVLGGFTPADFNGSCVVLSNTLDSTNPDITCTQAGANETSTDYGTASTSPVGVTFYSSAFITGTNNGVSGAAQLGTNSVNWTAGDILVGAPTSEFGSTGLTIVQGQATSIDGSQPSGPINIEDDGPTQSEYAISAENNTVNGVASFFGYVNGSYNQYFHFGYRPANNGAIIYVQGGEPVSPNSKPYSIFQDNFGDGTFGFNPGNGTFSFSGSLTVPALIATGAASKFASGTTFGGVLPCLQNGTNCPAGNGGGGGGTGSVTSVAAGTWPSWLSPTVSNATTTPTIAVTANAIPNSALANSATTVNGQTCTLGSTCTIPVAFAQVTGAVSPTQLPASTASAQGGVVLPSGASTNVLGAAAMLPGTITVNGNNCALGGTCTITAAPPADVKYYQAAVCDGGTAYASGVSRYDNQQPQAGCVLPASSALAYLAFNAVPALPQYAEATVSTPPYWTGTSMYINFYSTAVTGTVIWEVQAACVSAGSVVGTPSFGTAIPVTTTVSTTAGGDVVTALVSGIATPGASGCPATSTSPGLLTYRIYRSAGDSAAGNANLLGVTLVTGRSQ